MWLDRGVGEVRPGDHLYRSSVSPQPCEGVKQPSTTGTERKYAKQKQAWSDPAVHLPHSNQPLPQQGHQLVEEECGEPRIRQLSRRLQDREAQPHRIDLDRLVTDPLCPVEPPDPSQDDVADQDGGKCGRTEHDEPRHGSAEFATGAEAGRHTRHPLDHGRVQDDGQTEHAGRGRHHQRRHDRSHRPDWPRQKCQHEQRGGSVDVPPVEREQARRHLRALHQVECDRHQQHHVDEHDEQRGAPGHRRHQADHDHERPGEEQREHHKSLPGERLPAGHPRGQPCPCQRHADRIDETGGDLNANSAPRATPGGTNGLSARILGLADLQRHSRWHGRRRGRAWRRRARGSNRRRGRSQHRTLDGAQIEPQQRQGDEQDDDRQQHVAIIQQRTHAHAAGPITQGG